MVNLKSILEEEKFNKLDLIKKHVENLWKNNTGLPWHTFHDTSHNKKVEEIIFKLIPKNKYNLITSDEWFYLLAAVWLHDIGMILNLFGLKENFNDVRESHHERSSIYIMKENIRSLLDLESIDAYIISEICKYHRKKKDIMNCNEKIGQHRIRLLASYLRLADAIHIDSTRINEGRYKLLIATGMPWENRFHWFKSMWVQSIIPEPENLKICISVFDTPNGSKKGLLPQLIRDEIYEELNSIRDVLIRENVSYYLDIETNIIELPMGESRITFEEFISNIELENLSSATEVANSIIDTFIKLAVPSPDSYIVIKEYLNQVEIVLKARPCHILIKSILNNISKMTQDDLLPEESLKKQVKRICSYLESEKETIKNNISKLVNNASPFLLDSGNILLFGYSLLVLESLKNLPDEIKKNTSIFIAECRGKSQYTYTNEIQYCDGLYYAVQVKKAGFDDIKIVPDICVGNLMARKLINKVVFGANGIDKSGKFGHTAGHLAISDIAYQYNVPVYVIAITDKFGELDWHDDLDRNIQWLSRDQKTLDLLNKYNIETINPREDIVEPDKIDMLITEIGAFPPTRIPEALKSRIKKIPK